VERYQDAVFAMLSRTLAGRRPGSVEDLAQETFLRVFRALPDFRASGPARLSTWILTIASRLAIDELRKKHADGVVPESLTAPERADARVDRDAARRALLSALDALGDEMRAAFVLRAYHELSYEEIAEALGVELGTVKSRLSRAKASLREALTEVES
jgi:RNA polymerase sigma-70 factor (ECF subfamily)